jgi:uncharacterized membrane protein
MMHSLLESYLSEVAAQLSALPVKRRNEELREMRAHLENAVVVSRELGQSEDEAAQGIVAQFGTPRDLGDNLVWAWRRGATQDRRSFWGAAAYTLGLQLLIPVSLVPVLLTALHSPTGSLVNASFGVGIPFLVGAISGMLFSKRAVAGTALGAVSYHYVFGMSMFAYWINLPGNMRLVEPLSHYVWSFLAEQTEAVLITLFSAWIGSQLRLTWSRKKRLARV